jgi:hypothetical protein
LAVAGLVLDGVVHARLLDDVAIGMVVAGLLLIALAIEGFGERVQKWIIARKRGNQTGL